MGDGGRPPAAERGPVCVIRFVGGGFADRLSWWRVAAAVGWRVGANVVPVVEEASPCMCVRKTATGGHHVLGGQLHLRRLVKGWLFFFPLWFGRCVVGVCCSWTGVDGTSRKDLTAMRASTLRSPYISFSISQLVSSCVMESHGAVAVT